MQSEYFIFNGISSQSMQDMYLIRMEGGLVETPFFGGQSIEEEWLKDRITPYDFGTKLNPIEFSIKISPLEKKWTPELRSIIGQWLIHPGYKAFQTADDLNKYYYAKCIDAQSLYLMDGRGYLELTFRTNSAYAWSPIITPTYDLSTNTTNRIIQMQNDSNINRNYRPAVEVELVGGATEFKLKNISNKNLETWFIGLKANETISIDNENEDMVSSNNMGNPFSNFNGVWLELVPGINQIQVTGKCKIRTRMQFPILQ